MKNIKVLITAQATVFVTAAETDQEAIDAAIDNTLIGNLRISSVSIIAEASRDPATAFNEKISADVRCISEKPVDVAK